jgi:hypothetical protein
VKDWRTGRGSRRKPRHIWYKVLKNATCRFAPAAQTSRYVSQPGRHGKARRRPFEKCGILAPRAGFDHGDFNRKIKGRSERTAIFTSAVTSGIIRKAPTRDEANRPNPANRCVAENAGSGHLTPGLDLRRQQQHMRLND